MNPRDDDLVLLPGPHGTTLEQSKRFPRPVDPVPGLPNELILNILVYLSWRDVVHSRRVCRWVRDAVDRSARFQYQIALGLSSMEDRPMVGPLAIVDRLRLLDAQQQAWRNLTCCKAVTFPIPFTSSFYDFAGGIFGIGTMGRSELHWTTLPTSREVENGVELEWSHIQLGFKLTDFVMDIDQDLLILMEPPEEVQPIRIHFWTLSTHIPHPAASSPTLQHPSTSPGQSDFRVQIVGSHIGVIFRSSQFCNGGRLVIYSWTTGHIRAYVDAPPKGRLRSFAFISPSVFVIPWENTLGLYSFDCESIIDPAPESQPVVSFKLPDGRPKHYYFECYARPYLHIDRSYPKSDAIGISTLFPFSVDSQDGIIAFWLKPIFDGVVFVVHRSTLLSYLNGSQEARVIEWHAWGPKNTRWIDGYRHLYWFHTVSGHRLVTVEHSEDDFARKFIVVLDFNPSLISKALARSVPSDLVTARTLAGRYFFESLIESELPYLETRSSESFICSAALLDDHRILLLQKVADRFEDATLLLP